MSSSGSSMTVATRRLGRTFGPCGYFQPPLLLRGLNRPRLVGPMGVRTHARDVRGSRTFCRRRRSNALDDVSRVRREPLLRGRLRAMSKVRLLALRVRRPDPFGFQWKRSDLNSRIGLASVEEIGRASCRERGEMSVVGVAVRKKQYRRD